MRRSETRYAKSGDLNIAFQVVGDAPLDLAYVPGWVSNIDAMWDQPGFADFLERLAAFSRVILFDKRGTGLSDRVPNNRLPTLEERMDDLRAVLDAARSDRAAVLGHSEGASMAALYAATYPERTSALITFGAFAKRTRSADYPWAPTAEERESLARRVEEAWPNLDVTDLAPSREGDEEFFRQLANYLRQGASPGAAATLLRMNTEIDIRGVLSSIAVPTLLLHRSGDRDASVDESRYLASHIPGARFEELPGEDHLMWAGDVDGVVGAIEEVLTGARSVSEPERVLATILFTDVVGSTAMAAEVGDRRWRELLEQHHALVRAQLTRYRGQELDTAGDGFFARFDGPARAIRCASAIVDSVGGLGIRVRAGVHTGECELINGKVGGIAVHIGARVAAHAGPGEVFVSGTVRDLVAGSGLAFADRGAVELKGVPGEWRLYLAEQGHR